MPAEELDVTEDLFDGKVVRTFETVDTDGNRVQFKRGDVLTREQLIGFKNLKTLISVPNIVVRYGKRQESGERFIIKEKDGYTVIEGRKVNNKPLTREAAQELLEAS